MHARQQPASHPLDAAWPDGVPALHREAGRLKGGEPDHHLIGRKGGGSRKPADAGNATELKMTSQHVHYRGMSACERRASLYKRICCRPQLNAVVYEQLVTTALK
jgi:hypothetical protein